VSGAPYIEELRLTAFKSFRAARLPLRDLTLMIGRNGSGKSNAIDGLQVLSKLSQGEDIRDAIEGSRRGGSEIRGGTQGCAPFGETAFSLGCRVHTDEGAVELDLTVQVEPDVQIVRERLRTADGDLLVTEPPDPDSADIRARYDGDAVLPFRSTRMLTAQVATKLPSTTPALQRVHRAADAVVAALKAVFVLDPVPSLMRQYVPARDTLLRRQADNLSAVIGALLRDETTTARLRELVRSLPEQPVDDISVQPSSLGDVILALEERFGGRSVPVSARVMSDGMLRFLAFAAALLEAPLLGQDGDPGGTMLVIEEVENGLHPSQAARVVELIRAESERREVHTLATTHSPAILTALQARDHEGVVLCDRDPETGESRLRRLVELPAYARAMAAGTLGDAVTRLRLTREADVDDALRELGEILG